MCSRVSLQMLENAKPEDLGNDPAVEIQWAMKAGVHAETYMKLVKASPDRRKLRLTKCVFCVALCALLKRM